MQAETVATEPVPTPVVETAAAPVAETPAPLAGGDAAAAVPAPLAGGDATASAPVAAAPADTTAAAPLTGGGAELEGGKRKYKTRSRANKSRPHHAGRKCPSGTLRVSKRRKGDGHWVKVCSKSKWERRRRLSGGEASLEGGRRRRSRSRSRRH